MAEKTFMRQEADKKPCFRKEENVFVEMKLGEIMGSDEGGYIGVLLSETQNGSHASAELFAYGTTNGKEGNFCSGNHADVYEN